MPQLHVKRLETGEIVESVTVRGVTLPLSEAGERTLHRIMRGMLRTMNRDEFIIDDSEFYPARQDDEQWYDGNDNPVGA